MNHRVFVPLLLALGLTACADYEPHVKKASYDPVGQELVYPHPCPDWSHSASVNYDNSNHSNFGCAVENNIAAQLEDPADLYRGHGSGADTESTIRVVSRYRAGEIPVPLQPMESSQQ